MILDHIVATVVLGTATVAIDTIVTLASFLVAVLMSPCVMWHKERLQNFSILRRVHVSNLVCN